MRAELVVKNEDSTEEQVLSSMAGFAAINDEGDEGDLRMVVGEKCDGQVPPGSVLKCKLTYDFKKPQTSVKLQVKGVLEGSAYFQLVSQ